MLADSASRVYEAYLCNHGWFRVRYASSPAVCTVPTSMCSLLVMP